jgi:hypothetical protein
MFIWGCMSQKGLLKGSKSRGDPRQILGAIPTALGGVPAFREGGTYCERPKRRGGGPGIGS